MCLMSADGAVNAAVAVKALIAAVPACPVISKIADSVAHR
jgi:hypothetical protein